MPLNMVLFKDLSSFSCSDLLLDWKAKILLLFILKACHVITIFMWVSQGSYSHSACDSLLFSISLCELGGSHNLYTSWTFIPHDPRLLMLQVLQMLRTWAAVRKQSRGQSLLWEFGVVEREAAYTRAECCWWSLTDSPFTCQLSRMVALREEMRAGGGDDEDEDDGDDTWYQGTYYLF